MPAALSPDSSVYARIHYFRPDGDFSNWAIYSFGDTREPTDNYDSGPCFLSGTDSFGGYFNVALKAGATDLGFIVHNVSTGTKDPGTDMHLDVSRGREAWVVSGDHRVHTEAPTAADLVEPGLTKSQAFWIDRTTLALPSGLLHPGWTYLLVYSAEAELHVSAEWKLVGATDTLRLTPYSAGLTEEQRARFPQLTGYAVFHLPTDVSAELAAEILKGQIACAAVDARGALRYLTGIQQAGLLDELFYYSGKLGPIFDERPAAILIRLWAPTARNVELLLFASQADSDPASRLPMENNNRVWTAQTDPSWEGKYYLFRVSVYVPGQRCIVESLVSDPYSVDLALNGLTSRLTNLRNPATQPDGWNTHLPPALRTVRDLTIYELHVRDFSANDESVDEPHRGTYLAFTNLAGRGMQHLKALADAGVKAIHLLPTFHFSSVNEDKQTWRSPGDLSPYPPDSDEQQARVTEVQNEDAFNWGYDPVHYFAPQGAYAFHPAQRVHEYRRMVQALHAAGLRVIQDLVFNHTVASNQRPYSVLDKIVPGYYHRLDLDGHVESTSCCSDTASENRMMEKLMVDAIVHSAREYKIDGFRFDLMGLHLVSNLQRVKDALAALTLEKDGVDGSQIYLYGEAWEMGSIARRFPDKVANQRNLYGRGIGSFNDRIRDAIRGGNAFSEQRLQGFATGLWTSPSYYTNGVQSADDQLATLLQQTDWIKIALAGNLRDFTFKDSRGQTVTASNVSFNGQPAGYTAAPIEIINYCSVHDNQILFDAVQIKSAGDNSIVERARRQILAMSLVVFGQGVPFFTAGDDLLRSKDMDENSYDSGDWFNRLDFSYQTNNWGTGLPLAKDNARNWPIMRTLLGDPALRASAGHIDYARRAFLELLAVRESSRLFRMETLAEIQTNLTFLNSEPSSFPGAIVMRLDANGRDYGTFATLVVVFNGRRKEMSFADPSLKGIGLQLHPVQAASADAAVRSATYDGTTGAVRVAALTTVVFAAAR